MKKCYIDTNIIINENYFLSTRSRLFLKACRLQSINVFIPEIVLDETYGNYKKSLTKFVNALKKEEKNIQKLTELKAKKISIDERVQKYKHYINDLLNIHNVTVIPYPNINLKELVTSSYKQVKPYKTSGEGHKDYIVWKTIEAHINSEEESQNYFLVHNTSDFCEKNEQTHSLHPNLAESIDYNESIPKVYLSVKSFFKAEVEPHLENLSLEDLEKLGLQDIDNMIEEFLTDELEGYMAFGFEGVPFTSDLSIQMTSQPDISDIDIHKIGDEILIKVSGTLEIEADGFIDKADFIPLYEHDTTRITIIDNNWNDHVMSVSTVVETAFEATFIYSTHTKEVLNKKLDLIQEIRDEWH